MKLASGVSLEAAWWGDSLGRAWWTVLLSGKDLEVSMITGHAGGLYSHTAVEERERHTRNTDTVNQISLKRRIIDAQVENIQD